MVIATAPTLPGAPYVSFTAGATSGGSYPPLLAPGGAYDRTSSTSYGPGDRYVLYDDGLFSVQSFLAGHFYETRGRYSRVNSTIVFDFEASSRAGSWQATGKLSGDDLSISYNEVMTGRISRTACTAKPRVIGKDLTQPHRLQPETPRGGGVGGSFA